MASIAVIGSGRIGGNLARAWAARGHEITFGARDPGKPELVELAREVGAAREPVDEAAAHADVVVFAVPGGAMAETVSQLGTLLDGTVVIDAANNMRAGRADSRAIIAAVAPAAAYYRAFNSYGWEMIGEPVVGGAQADAFFCGPDGAPRALVEQLIEDVCLRPIWVGDADQVEVVDGVLRLWFSLVRQGRGRRLAFKVLAD